MTTSKPTRRRALRHLLAGAGAAATVLAGDVRAQSWPVRPVKLIVPFPAGSSPDVIARLLADPLAAELGQAVYIDNRPGAGGNLGTATAARAAPDGYTLLLTIQGPLVTAPLLTRGLGYDPATAFAPISLVATAPNVLVVEPALGAATLADFVRAAKRHAGEWNYGSIGVGSASHLAMELFKTRTGIDIQHVPYQGFPQIVTAMLAGEVQAAFMVPGNAIGHIQAGRLKALGVTTRGRSPVLPGLPSFIEQGYPDFEAISWQAVMAPSGTPVDVIERVSRALERILGADEIRARMLGQFFSAAGGTPESLGAFIRGERERWGQVIKAAGVKPE